MADSQVAARRWPARVLALLAGAALTAAFAPHDLWPLAVLAPAALLVLWERAATPRECAALGFAFGIGLYAAGTWWLYISIRGFGQAPIAVAVLVMGALVLIMAAWQAVLGYVAGRWLAPGSLAGRLLFVPAAWVLVEAWRGWFLTGFPWLSLGLSQTDTWLAGLAPVGGVPLLSLALLCGAGALVTLWRARGAERLLALVVLVVPWTTGLALRPMEWTREAGPARSVAIVQGAVSQDMKWLADNRQNILDTYARLHDSAIGAELVVWPESALPEVANDLADYVGDMWSRARAGGSAVIMGIMRAELRDGEPEPAYFNAIVALGREEASFYDKRHLVPFAEYFPVPAFVRTWLRLMNLPYSDFTPGAPHQPPLQLAGLSLAASICYEDAYPALLRGEIRAADALVTVTNDAWFGRSAARYQHLQIARMRALESRRSLIRAANDGVSALIGPDGRIVAQAPEFAPAVLRTSLVPRRGDTPYLRVGDWPVLGVALALLGARAWRLLRSRGAAAT